jgi:hypothetical protein
MLAERREIFVSGLPQMFEMVANSQKAFEGQIRHFIVSEVRPAQ